MFADFGLWGCFCGRCVGASPQSVARDYLHFPKWKSNVVTRVVMGVIGERGIGRAGKGDWCGRVAVFRDGRPGISFSGPGFREPGDTLVRVLLFHDFEDASRVTALDVLKVDECAKSLGREGTGVLIAGLNSEKRDSAKARGWQNDKVAAQI